MAKAEPMHPLIRRILEHHVEAANRSSPPGLAGLTLICKANAAPSTDQNAVAVH